MKKELVAQLGRSDAVGRPMLYGTTDQFLMEFGFETLKDLPEIEDIEGVLDESEADSDDILYTEQIAIELPSGE